MLFRYIKENKSLIYFIFKYLIFTIHPLVSSIALFFITAEFLIKDKKELLLEYLLLITTLSVGNTSLFKLPPLYETLKFILIIFLLIKIILKNLKKDKEINLKKIYVIWSGYIGYFIITSFFFSSYFFISISKLIYYFIGHTICYLIVNNIFLNKIFKILLRYFYTITFLNIITLFLSLGYIRTKIGFQGIYGNPNGLGIIIAMFYAIYLSSCMYKDKKNFILINILSILFIVLTNSRTSIFTVAISFLYFLWKKKYKKDKKIKVWIIVLILVVSSSIVMQNKIMKVVYKGNKNIFYSRQKLIDKNIKRFKSNPFFGQGFAVENKVEKEQLYKIEKGNTVLQILSDGGIFGLLYFLGIIIFTKCNIKRNRNIIFYVLLLTNMGEATLFAFNGIGTINILLFYFLFK